MMKQAEKNLKYLHVKHLKIDQFLIRVHKKIIILTR